MFMCFMQAVLSFLAFWDGNCSKRSMVASDIFTVFVFNFSIHLRQLKYPSGQPYFTDYFESLWDMYVSVTTANFPGIKKINVFVLLSNVAFKFLLFIDVM
jgi:hypothetical protein